MTWECLLDLAEAEGPGGQKRTACLGVGRRDQDGPSAGGCSGGKAWGLEQLLATLAWDYWAFCVLSQLTEGKMMERRKKIALELSELVVYCRPVPFDEESKLGIRAHAWESAGKGALHAEGTGGG